MRNKREKGYHKLIIWARLKELLVLVYKLTNQLPQEEKYGLKSQMRRAIVSVMSNFVEGYLKRSIKEKLHFLEISTTSLIELEAQGEICLILNYWNKEDYLTFDDKRGEIAYLLYKYKLAIN